MKNIRSFKILAFAFILILAMVFFAGSAYADTKTSGDLDACKWSFDEDTGILRIWTEHGIGSIPNFEHYETRTWEDKNKETHKSDVPWIAFRNQIKVIRIEHGIQSIGQGAFFMAGSKDCPMTVILPKSSTNPLKIGDHAFESAKIGEINLNTNAITDIGEWAFRSAVMPDYLEINGETIGYQAFRDITTEHIEFGQRVKSIDNYAFYGVHLDKIQYLPGTIEHIGFRAIGFYNDYYSDTAEDRQYHGIIYTEKGSMGEYYAQAYDPLSEYWKIEYGKHSYHRDHYYSWTFEESTGTLKMNCIRYYENNSSPGSNDEMWARFVNKYGSLVKELYINVENQESRYEEFHISDTFKVLTRLENVSIYSDEYTQTSIDAGAFEGMESLRSVVFENNISEIGYGAFRGCAHLLNVQFYSYQWNELYDSDVTKIGARAFENCNWLNKVDLNPAIREIGDYAFRHTYIKELDIGSIQNEEFTLGEGVFSDSLQLESVNLGDKITSIPKSTFEGSPRLTKVVYSDQMTSVGAKAFKNCEALKNFEIKKSLTSIGAEAFMGTGFCNILVPRWITEIGSKALNYADSTKLVEGSILYVLEGTEGLRYAESEGMPYEINEGGYDGNMIWRFNPETGALHLTGSGAMPTYTSQNNPPWFTRTDKITSIDIGGELTEIGSKAFYAEEGDYEHLEKVVIGDSITTIGLRAFHNCPLQEIVIPPSVTTIKTKAFGYKDKDGKDVINTDLIVYVTEGSKAEEYALNAGLTCDYSMYVGETGDVRYRYDKKTNTLRIFGSGRMADYSTGLEQPWHDYRDQIITVIVEEGVTSVGDLAFAGTKVLGKVILPEGLTKIGDYAFASGDTQNNLYRLMIPDSVTTIGKNIINYYVGDPDKGIDGGNWMYGSATLYTMNDASPAFSFAEGNDHVTAVKGRMGYMDNMPWTFEYASGSLTLGGIEFPEHETYPWNDFKEEIRSIGVESNAAFNSIPDYAFSGLPYLEKVTSLGVKDIGKGAFEDCTSLRSVKLPDLLKVVKEDTFRGCTSLSSIALGRSVKTVEKNAFRDCVSLASVGLGENIETIEESAFEGCSSLSKVTLNYFMTTIGDRAFANSGVAELTTNNKLSSIGKEAFFNTPLTAVSLRRSVVIIGERALGYKGSYDSPVASPEFTISTPHGSEAYYYIQANGLTWFDPNSGDLGDIHWNFDDATLTLRISGSGDLELDGETAPWSEFNYIIERIIIENGITSIGDRVFKEMSPDPLDSYPVKLEISGSVNSIGEEAFDKTHLKEIIIPLGVEYIGPRAFRYSNVGISENGFIKISASVREIGEEAFVGTGYDYWEYDPEYDTGDDHEYTGSIKIPPNVKAIGDKAFGYQKGDDGYDGELKLIPWYLIVGVDGSAAQEYAEANEGIYFEAYVPDPGEHYHFMVYVEGKDPTTTEKGYKPYYYCEDCGEWFWDVAGEEPIEDHSAVDLPMKPSLNYSKKSLKAGNTVTLKVKNGTAKSWKTSAKAVATVTFKGMVTTLKKGAATITATLKDGSTLKCKITVTTSPTITIGGKKFKASTTYKVKKGKYLTVKITGRAASVANVYSTSKKTVAKVTTTSKKTSTVKIKGLKAGKANVTIKVNGIAFKIKVQVTK